MMHGTHNVKLFFFVVFVLFIWLIYLIHLFLDSSYMRLFHQYDYTLLSATFTCNSLFSFELENAIEDGNRVSKYFG